MCSVCRVCVVVRACVFVLDRVLEHNAVRSEHNTIVCAASVSSCVIGREGMGPVSGTFVAKLWAGGEQQPLLAEMRSRCSFLPLQYFSNLSLSLFSHFAQCLQIFYRQTMQAAGLATRECRNVFCLSRVQRGK